MRPRLGFRTTSLLVLLSLVPLSAAQPLVVAYQENNAEPYSMVIDGKMVGGIIKNVCDALGKSLGVPVEYRLVPRKRLESDIAKGLVSMIAVINPAWVDKPSALLWSVPLFTESNRFVVAGNGPKILTSTDLRGLHIGTILGYYYVGLEELFARGFTFRQDVRTLLQNFQKLGTGRIDTLVDSDILIQWRIGHLAGVKPSDFQLSEFVLSRQDIYWAVSPQSTPPPAKILAALKRLKESGEIDRILARYR
jgi:polar amino acid transport system substrate-binding protein